MESKLRLETELRLLMTAAVTDDADIREKILDFPCFSTREAQRIADIFTKVYISDPDADYSVLFAALDRSEQVAMIEMTESAISQEINELKVDSTLASLRKISAEESMRRRVSELMISDSYGADDLRAIADEAEAADSPLELNTKQRYIDDYDTVTEVIPTGYSLLDKLLGGGLAKGTVSAFGARPSVGKTTLAVNIAAHNSSCSVLFFSLEMSARMVYDKLLADVGDLDYSDCVKHRINKDTVSAALKKYDRLTVIDDVYEIEEMARIIRQIKPELVVIDYIQIVRTMREIDIVRQRIDYISGVIKRTAKSTGAHITCLSQITRGAKEEPTMSALKESGGLEETSDYVFLLKRPYVLDKSDERLKPEDTELKIDKNKFGESGVLEFYFDGAHQRFSEVGFLSEKKSGHDKQEQIARMKGEIRNGQEGLDEDLPF